VFNSNTEGSLNLFWQLADGTVDGSGWQQAAIRRRHSPGRQMGKQLAYSEINDVSGYDIWVLRLATQAEPFLRTPSTEAAAKVLPGRPLVGVSVE